MRRLGFTLVELLVAIAIIGFLIALLLPAVQATREAARKGECVNNQRQIGIALLQFHDAAGQFPPGGWGHEWVGTANRGNDERQPGGWIYNVLPFCEQRALHDASAGSPASSEWLEAPLSLFNCPTRRECAARPISSRFAYMHAPKPTGAPKQLGRGDYAVNGGVTLAYSHNGPATLAEGDSSHIWPDLVGHPSKPDSVFTGISHLRTGTQLRKIVDGTSHTYLAGEKYLDPSHYFNGESFGDNESLYSGYCSDNHRYVKIDQPPAPDGSLPLPDTLSSFRFGSAHASGLNFLYCDGSVRFVTYEIPAEIHYLAAHIADQGIAPRGF